MDNLQKILTQIQESNKSGADQYRVEWMENT